MNDISASAMPETKDKSASLEWRTNSITAIAGSATDVTPTVNAVVVPSADTIENNENRRPYGGFSEGFFMFNVVLSIAVSVMFLCLQTIVHLQYWWRAAEWTAYFLLLFFIPITAMMIITCGNPTDSAKLFVRPYYSSMAIWALVYVVVGPVWVPELGQILVNGLIGLAASLYYWGLLEYWFKLNNNEEVDEVEILSAKVVEEDPLERA